MKRSFLSAAPAAAFGLALGATAHARSQHARTVTPKSSEPGPKS